MIFKHRQKHEFSTTGWQITFSIILFSQCWQFSGQKGKIRDFCIRIALYARKIYILCKSINIKIKINTYKRYRRNKTSWIGAVANGDDAMINGWFIVTPNIFSNFLPDSGPKSRANWWINSAALTPADVRNFCKERTISWETSGEEYSVSRTSRRTPTAFERRVPLANKLSCRWPTNLANCKRTLPPSSCNHKILNTKCYIQNKRSHDTTLREWYKNHSTNLW